MKRENRRLTTPPLRRSRVANECIDAVLRGDLNSAREIARRNVGRCDGLAAELRSLRESLDELRVLPACPDFTGRILASMDDAAQHGSLSPARMSASRRFAFAAGLVIVTVFSGLFRDSEETAAPSQGQIASVISVAPDEADEHRIALGDISRYETGREVDAPIISGSGGVLALAPQELADVESHYRGPLTASQAVLNVKSKNRGPSSNAKRK